MNTRTKTDDEILSRLGQYNLQKHDYVFGIALTTSILISMLKSFVESTKNEHGEIPESMSVLLNDLEALLHAMGRGSGEAHMKTGREKAVLLLEEVFRIVKTPSTKVQ